MNGSQPLPYQLLSVENDVFTTYSFWAGALVIKMILMSFLTAFQRLRKKVCSVVQSRKTFKFNRTSMIKNLEPVVKEK